MSNNTTITLSIAVVAIALTVMLLGMKDCAQSETDNIGASGYSAALSVSGLTVRLEVTAASGVRSVAFLEGFGVEMALTAA